MKTLYGYCFDNTRLPVELTVSALREADFVEDIKIFIPYNNAGTGKAYLATAIGAEACISGTTLWLFDTAGLVNQLSEPPKRGEVDRFSNQLGRTVHRICDESG